jgi:hypothetical protein
MDPNGRLTSSLIAWARRQQPDFSFLKPKMECAIIQPIDCLKQQQPQNGSVVLS